MVKAYKGNANLQMVFGLDLVFVPPNQTGLSHGNTTRREYKRRNKEKHLFRQLKGSIFSRFEKLDVMYPLPSDADMLSLRL